MDLQLNNSWDYDKDERWDWSAYLTGADLPKVDHVEYILHPTFKKPLRKVTDPTDGFRMDASGWGRFELKAIVHLKDGTQQLLTHEVRLSYMPKKGRSELRG